jgi:hypothetical protein
MKHWRASDLLLAGSALLLILSWTTAGAALQAADAPEKPIEQVFKNIHVLNGLPASQKDGVMAFMAASLGVGCTHCHVNPWDSDEMPAKLAARRMILMTRKINQDHFGGAQVVNCYTCHQGRLQPAANAAGEDPAWQMLDSAPEPAATLPTLDQIVARYVRAAGGEAAIDRMTSRVSQGAQITTNRWFRRRPTGS